MKIYEAWDHKNDFVIYAGVHKSEMDLAVADYLEFNEVEKLDYYVNGYIQK